MALRLWGTGQQIGDDLIDGRVQLLVWDNAVYQPDAERVYRVEALAGEKEPQGPSWRARRRRAGSPLR